MLACASVHVVRHAVALWRTQIEAIQTIEILVWAAREMQRQTSMVNARRHQFRHCAETRDLHAAQLAPLLDHSAEGMAGSRVCVPTTEVGRSILQWCGAVEPKLTQSVTGAAGCSLGQLCCAAHYDH